MDQLVVPSPWLWRPRPGLVRFIEIHATRGPAGADQYQGTINWMSNPNNGSAAKGWGGACSKIIGDDGSMALVLSNDKMPTFAAGYGALGPAQGGWSIDQYGISYQICQSAALEPFTDAQYRRGAKETAKDCVENDIPPVFLEIPRQEGPVPTGLVRHDRCENGYEYGKSDPGAQFNETYFLSLLRSEIAALKEEPMKLVRAIPSGKVYVLGEVGKRWIDDGEELGAYFAAGYDPVIVDITDFQAAAIPNVALPTGGAHTH